MYHNPTPLVPCVLTGTHYERDGGWEHTSFRKAFIRISTALHFWRDTLKHFNLKWYKRTLAAQSKVWENEAHKRNWINRCVFEWRDRHTIFAPLTISRIMPSFQSTPNHMLYWKVHSENDSKLARKTKTEKYKEADKDLGDSIQGIVHSATVPSVVGVWLALKNGACPNEINALISAMRSYKTNGTKVSAEILDLFLKWPGMDLRNDPWYSRGPLHWVIEEYPFSTPPESQRLIEVADKLIDTGLDVDAQNSDGDTPLLLLCRTHISGVGATYFTRTRRSVELMGHLIACGADINARDAQWNTPLMVAIQRNNVRLAHELLDHGADVRMYNKDVLMPCNIATAAVQTATAPGAMAHLAQRIDAVHNAQNA